MSSEVVDIKKIWESPYLKFLIRQGIPEVHRSGVCREREGGRGREGEGRGEGREEGKRGREEEEGSGSPLTSSS